MTGLTTGRIGEVRRHPTRGYLTAILGTDAPGEDAPWWLIGHQFYQRMRHSNVEDWPVIGTVPGTPAAAASGETDDAAIADHLMRAWLAGDVWLPEGELLDEVRAKAQVEGLLPLGPEDEV